MKVLLVPQAKTRTAFSFWVLTSAAQSRPSSPRQAQAETYTVRRIPAILNLRGEDRVSNEPSGLMTALKAVLVTRTGFPTLLR